MTRPRQFTIEVVEAWDSAELADLWLASWAATYPDIDFNARRTWFGDHMALLKTQGCITLLARDTTGMLAGFVMFDRVSGWLDQFSVHPLAFGSGIAGQLMDEAKQLSPGYLQLDVNADNERALAFYERQAFRLVGEGTNPNSGARTLTMEWRDTRMPTA